MQDLENDYPIITSKQDALERTNYAENIAEIMRSFKKEDLRHGIVLGLYGEWGSGKTSLINIIQEKLCENEFFNSNTNVNYDKYKHVINNIFTGFCILFLWCFDFTTFILNFTVVENIIDAFKFFNIYQEQLLFILFLIIKVIITIYMVIKPIRLNAIYELLEAFHDKFLINKKQVNKNMIINFAPWNTTNEETILKDFFSTLRNHISTTPNAELLLKFDNYISNLCNSLSKGIIHIENKFNIFDSKQDLINSLINNGKKIYIFIDDIDRLSCSEIYLMFKIIKSLANLPNIVYFLSFDKNIVASALDKYHSGCGQSYIDKIVQIPFEIPSITNKQIQKYLFNELDKLLSDSPILEDEWELDYKDYWATIYAPEFCKFFHSIRDIKRFVNSFKISYTQQICKEVNIIDFWIITAIKIFIPNLYKFIIEHKTFLTEKQKASANNSLDENEKEYIKSTLDEIIKNMHKPLQNSIRTILCTLFPNLSNLYEKILSIQIYDDKKQYRMCRICVDDYFDTYFKFDRDSESLTNSYMKECINLTDNCDLFAKRLIDIDQESKLKNFLNKFENYTSIHFSPENIKNIFKVLFEYGDYFQAYDDEFWGIDIYVSIERIIYQLLENNEQISADLLKSSISVKKSIIPAISFVGLINRMLEQNQVRNYVNQEILDKFKNEILDAIIELANNDINNIDDISRPYNGHIIEHKRANNILHFWYRYGIQQQVKEYVNKVSVEDKNLLKILDKIKHTTKSSVGYGQVKIRYKIYAKDLVLYFDLESLQNRLEKIDISVLSDNEKNIINLTLEGIKNKDKDPYSDFDDE